MELVQVAWLRQQVANELKVADLTQLKMVWEGRVLTDPETVPTSTEGKLPITSLHLGDRVGGGSLRSDLLYRLPICQRQWSGFSCQIGLLSRAFPGGTASGRGVEGSSSVLKHAFADGFPQNPWISLQ